MITNPWKRAKTAVHPTKNFILIHVHKLEAKSTARRKILQAES